jgi:hypothetical protein
MVETGRLIVAVVALAACGGRPCLLESTGGDDLFDEHTVVVRFDATVATEAEAARVLAAADVRAETFLMGSPLYAYVAVPDGRPCPLIDRLEATPGVDDAFVNLIIHAQ